LASFCVWTKSLICKDAANRDSTVQSEVRRISKFPVSRPDAHLSTAPSVRTMCHPVRTPDNPASSVRMMCFFCPNTSLYRAIPSGLPSIHCSIHPDDVLLPSGHFTVSRSFCASLLRLNISATRTDAYQFSNGSLILSKFQEREDQSTVRTMWYTVQTRISVRQESQFKMNRPDI